MRDARHALYREHVLDAAEEIFAETGYEATTVQSVAAAAGVSLATLYGVFKNKWDLYRGVHSRRIQALYGFIRTKGEAPTDPLDRMLAGIDAYIEFHMMHPHYLCMHLREGHLWSRAELPTPEQQAAWAGGLRMMAKAFELGIRAGIYVDDDRPELMARTTMAIHQVRLAQWVDDGMKESVAKVTDQVHRQFIRAFCRPHVVAARLGRR
jgi:AcrR family transcriptional regulator